MKKNGKPAPYAVEMRHVATVKPYPANAKAHSEEAVQKLATLIQRFGFRVPIVVDAKGVILKGHRTFRAALKIGMTSVPVHVAAGLSATEARAWRLADNRVAQDSGWDDDLLRTELGELQAGGFDLALTGFGRSEIEAMLKATANGLRLGADPDAVDPLPAVPVTRKGDLILLGKHRLLCGDSTSAADVARLLDGTTIHAILTDPPYCSGGFQEAGRAQGSIGTSAKVERIANDTLSTRGYIALLRAVFNVLPAGIAYVFTDWRMWVNLFDVVESSGYGVRSMVVWNKGTPGMGQGWRSQHELIMCGVRIKVPFNNKKAQGNVIDCARTGNPDHPTQKPVELLAKVLDVTDGAEMIADPFAGSGSTLIACEQMGRTAYLMELSPAFCDVVVRRWEQATSQTAQRPERVAA